MIDYSKIDWSKCELPEFRYQKVRASCSDEILVLRGITFEVDGHSLGIAWMRLDTPGKWTMCLEMTREEKAIVDAMIGLVERFVDYQSSLDPAAKIPDVCPPHGLRWYLPEETIGGKSVCLGHRKKECVIVARVPDSALKRDAMLACVEAFDGEKQCTFYLDGGTFALGGIPGWLEPGNYAVSFRRIEP
jgi:hypothetical protein